MYSDANKISGDRILLFLGCQGDPNSWDVLEGKESMAGKAKTPHCDWHRGLMHPWHRVPQKKIFQGPKMALLGFLG